MEYSSSLPSKYCPGPKLLIFNILMGIQHGDNLAERLSQLDAQVVEGVKNYHQNYDKYSLKS